jgi:hypothetical protein
LARKERLLVLGPSFRRNRDPKPVPAFQRYDGLFYRVAKSHLNEANDIDILVMKDNLLLVDGSSPLPYEEPEGERWGRKTVLKSRAEKARVQNGSFLRKKLKGKKYSEILISMGKEYAAALPELSDYGLRILFPASGGPGPKAQALKAWLLGE